MSEKVNQVILASVLPQVLKRISCITFRKNGFNYLNVLFEKKSLLLCTALILTAPVCIPLLSTGNESFWVKTNGPVGGLINTIEIDFTQPDVLYAGGTGGGVFKSADGGNSWVMLEQIVPPSEEIRDLSLSPDGETIYALTHLLYKSSDKGEIWQCLDQVGGLSCMDVSWEHSIVVLGTWDGRAYMIKDENWKDITSNLPGEFIADIAVGTPDEFWVGTSNGENGRLYHTTDRGTSWTEVILEKPKDTDIRTIFVDPDFSNIVYVGLVNVHNEPPESPEDVFLYKTDNSGATWQPVYLPGSDAMVHVMGRISTDDTVYVGTGGNVFKSENGYDWIWITPPGRNGDMYDIAVDPQNADILYLPRRAHGICKSVNGGKTWTPINEGLCNVTVSLLAVPPVPGTVYATAVSGEGIYKTTDYGETWINITDGITHPWADEIVVTPHNPESVWYIADVAEGFVTTNSGKTWEKTIDPYGKGFRFGSVHALAPAPSNSDVLYVLKNGFGIFKSFDRGENWRFLHQSEVDYTYSIAVHPANPDIVYSGYNPKPFQDWAMVRKTTDGGGTWETVLSVPHAGAVTSVAIDFLNPDIIYAAATGKGIIFQSTDGGETWLMLNEHFTMCTVWGQPQLVIDLNNPQVAYTATWLAGTWKTTDAGKTWTLLENAPVSSTALSIDPENSNIIYSADRTQPKLWKSTDSGKTWEEIADFSDDGAFLLNRVLAEGSTVYAATFGPTIHGGKLYKSENAGETWFNITGDLPRSVLDIAVDPTNPNIIYVTTHVYGCYKSENAGETWTQLHTFPNIGAYDIEVDPVDPTILYACGMGGGSVPDWCMKPGGYTFTDDSGVYKSTDAGMTWNTVLTTSNECRAVRLHPENHNILFAAAMDDGLQISTDGGETWTSYNAGLDTQVLTSCAVAGDKIYVGTQACGVYSGDITNWSVEWQPERSNKPVPLVYSLQITVDPTNSNRIFVGSNPGGLYRSDDGGKTFYDKNFLTPSVVVDDPFRQGYYTVALNPENPDEVWLSTWGKGIYKSYDGMDFDIGADGADRTMYGKHINQILISENTIYVATEEGIFRSRDGGRTWDDFSTGLDTRQVRTLAVTADRTLLCGTLGYELYFYNVSETRWEQMPAFGNFGTLWPIWDDRPLYQYTSLLFHPENPDIIYCGTFPAGMYKSIDGGKSWQEINVGWTNDGVFSLVFHPEDYTIIYAGTYNGVNCSTDSGEHWEMWDNGWPDEQWVFSIDFDPRNPDVMYACSKNGENEGTGREGFHGTVMKSTDGGRHWGSITTGLNIDQEFYKIIVDPYDPDILYLATQQEGVFISHDSGDHWQPWNEGLTNVVAGTNGNNVTNTMVLSADRYLYFGSAGSGVFRRALGFEGEPPVPEKGSEVLPSTKPPEHGLPLIFLAAGALIVVILLIGFRVLYKR